MGGISTLLIGPAYFRAFESAEVTAEAISTRDGTFSESAEGELCRATNQAKQQSMLAAANRIAPRVLIQWKRCNTSWVPKHISDKYGIPERPTWSVHELLSSYPSPKLSQETIQKLHRLSALTCPAEDTSEYKTRKENLEEMIRLVEAVRLVDTTGVEIRGRGEEEDADRTNVAVEADIGGQRLLKHASRTQDGFYVVDSERRS